MRIRNKTGIGMAMVMSRSGVADIFMGSHHGLVMND